MFQILVDWWNTKIVDSKRNKLPALLYVMVLDTISIPDTKTFDVYKYGVDINLTQRVQSSMELYLQCNHFLH